MLGWIRKSFLRRRPGLFRFHDGTRMRSIDPFKAFRTLIHHPEFNLDAHPPLVDLGAEPETTVTVKALCEAFGVRRWDDSTATGLTEWEILDLLRQFEVYLDALKKNGGSGPTSPQPTEPTSSSDSPERRDETGNVFSASGSTPSGPSAERPTASTAA